MSALSNRPTFNFNLEALRGLAALVVVWHHVIYHQHHLDPSFTPSGIWSYNPPGHVAVVVFFVLSGYVIGRNHPERLRLNGIGTYLRKRFTRVYPMYVLAVLAGVVASGFTISGRSVVFHLLFWQSWGEPVMFENNPLWSLQYEVLYYLAFIPLSVLGVRPWLVTTLVAVGGALALFLKPTQFTVSAVQYSIGFMFWLVGWALAALPSKDAPAWPRVLSAMLLMLCLEYFNTIIDLLRELNSWMAVNRLTFYQGWDVPASAFNTNWGFDYAYLPYAPIIVLTVAGVGGRVVNGLMFVLLLLPLYSIYQVSGRWGADLTIPALLYAISLLVYFMPGAAVVAASRAVVQRLIPVGAISYGIYIIHFPIVFLFGKVDFFSGSVLTFTVRAVVYLALTIAAATWLDKVFQPWVRRWLGPARAPSAPVADAPSLASAS